MYNTFFYHYLLLLLFLFFYKGVRLIFFRIIILSFPFINNFGYFYFLFYSFRELLVVIKGIT